MTAAIILAGATLVLTWILTGWVRRYALRHAVLDHPNPRSSHRIPIPTGGGVAIAAALLPAIAVAAWSGLAPRSVAIALFGGFPVVLIGWIDDRRGLGALPRLVVQVAAACWAIGWLGGFPAIRLGLDRVELGSAGTVVGVIGIVWAMNCFNFMDGIDGLAGGEAVTVGIGGALLLSLGGHPGLALLPLLIAAASAGFLVWNWDPARIFMGDAGSGFLGFLFGTLAAASENSGALPLAGWLTLLGVFVFDATTTLLLRMWRRERWYEAHRTHGYQRAVECGFTHRQVALAILAINCCLFVLASIGSRWPLSQVALVLGSIMGLGVVRFVVHRAWRARVSKPAAGPGMG